MTSKTILTMPMPDTVSGNVAGRPGAVVEFDGQNVTVDGQTPDRNPVAQAQACARYIAELLAKLTGRPSHTSPARPVILYPGWYTTGSSGKSLWVLNPKMFCAYLDREDDCLSDADIGLFYTHLATLPQVRDHGVGP